MLSSLAIVYNFSMLFHSNPENSFHAQPSTQEALRSMKIVTDGYQTPANSIALYFPRSLAPHFQSLYNN